MQHIPPNLHPSSIAQPIYPVQQSLAPSGQTHPTAPPQHLPYGPGSVVSVSQPMPVYASVSGQGIQAPPPGAYGPGNGPMMQQQQQPRSTVPNAVMTRPTGVPGSDLSSAVPQMVQPSSMPEGASVPVAALQNPFVKEQLTQLRAQINAYKLLSKSQPVPENLLMAAEGRAFLGYGGATANQPHPWMHQPTQPGQPYGEANPLGNNNGQVAVHNDMRGRAAAQSSPMANRMGPQVAYQSYPSTGLTPSFLSGGAHTFGRSRLTPIQRPQGLDPVELLKEREQRIQSRIAQRIKELSSLTVFSTPEQRVSLLLELRALRLLNFQRQLRQDIVSSMRRDTSLETALNVKAYRRPKKQTLREARFTEKLEKQMKCEQEKRRRQKHQEFLNAILTHGKDFREFHRNVSSRVGKINKAILSYKANAERDKRKEQERIDRERMRRLLAEDEEGYRCLIDEKKNQRLCHLLAQTDEFMNNLTKLVVEHKREQNKLRVREKSDRRKQAQESAFANAVTLYRRMAEEILKAGGPPPNFLTSLPTTDKFPEEFKQVNRDWLNGKTPVYTLPLPEVRIPMSHTMTKEICEGEAAPLAVDVHAWLHDHPGWEVSRCDVVLCGAFNQSRYIWLQLKGHG